MFSICPVSPRKQLRGERHLLAAAISLHLALVSKLLLGWALNNLSDTTPTSHGKDDPPTKQTHARLTQ